MRSQGIGMNVDATFMLAGTAETGLVFWYRGYCLLKFAESAVHESGGQPSSVNEMG